MNSTNRMKKTSHTQMRRLIQAQKTAITDKELFTSPVFTAYLNDMTETALKRSGNKVVTYWDERPTASVAYTDNTTITINAGNIITKSFRTRNRRAYSIVGLNTHEIGHILYTDFTLLTAYNESFKAGKIYPNEPTGLSSEDELSLAEIKGLLTANDTAAIRVIMRIADKIVNVIEDEYVESCIRSEFTARFKNGMAINNNRAAKLMPPIEQQIDEDYNDFSILMNMFILYQIKRDKTMFSSYKREYLDVFNDCVPYIDNSVYDPDATARYNAANHIIVKLWRYIKPLIDRVRADEQELKETLEQIIDQLFKELSEQIMSIGSNQGNGASDLKSDDDTVTPPYEYNTDTAYDEDETGEMPENDSGAEDIERVLEDMAKDKVCEELENELTAELRKEADKISRCAPYADIHINVNRINPVESRLVKQYNLVSPPLLKLSKRLQEQVYQVLQNKRDGGKMTGLYMGKRINSHSLVKDDGRIFYNTRLPGDNPEIAVALLVDESGSMVSNNRIKSARETAIIIYDFCVKLGIPVIVYGHSTSYRDKETVEMYAYAEFDSYDGKDVYRMIDMKARGNNHDGAALRYVAERLMTRDEETKLLILLSDGQPAADEYYGIEAETDLRNIKREYTNRGITMFAAAIGNDKEQIERIYGGGFLDITDLNRLPVNLVALIERYIK